MGKNWTPSIVPSDVDLSVYLVLDDLGPHSRVWRETPTDRADVDSVISDLATGQYNDPLRVVAFNLVDHTADDVSADIAAELQRRADLANDDLSSTVEEFVLRHLKRERQLTLRLM